MAFLSVVESTEVDKDHLSVKDEPSSSVPTIKDSFMVSNVSPSVVTDIGVYSLGMDSSNFETTATLHFSKNEEARLDSVVY